MDNKQKCIEKIKKVFNKFYENKYEMEIFDEEKMYHLEEEFLELLVNLSELYLCYEVFKNKAKKVSKDKIGGAKLLIRNVPVLKTMSEAFEFRFARFCTFISGLPRTPKIFEEYMQKVNMKIRELF